MSYFTQKLRMLLDWTPLHMRFITKQANKKERGLKQGKEQIDKLLPFETF